MERRRLIGEILVDHGWCTAADVDAALKQQAVMADQGASGTKPIGTILVEMGKVTDDQIREALEEQGKAMYQEADSVAASSEVWGVTDQKSKAAQESHETETASVRPSAPRVQETTARPSVQTRAQEPVVTEAPAPVAAGARETRSEPRSATMNSGNTGDNQPRNDPSWRPGTDYDNERRGILGIPWLQYVIVPTVAATAIMFGVKWYLNRRRKRATRMEWLRNQINDASDRISSMRK
jgi:hypothetical protein